MVLGGNINIFEMFKYVNKIKEIAETLQRELPTKQVVGESGGGMVAVQMNGKQEVTGVYIDERLIKSGDKAMIETLLASATNQAVKKTQDLVKEELKKILGDMDLPPGISNLLGMI